MHPGKTIGGTKLLDSKPELDVQPQGLQEVI